MSVPEPRYSWPERMTLSGCTPGISSFRPASGRRSPRRCGSERAGRPSRAPTARGRREGAMRRAGRRPRPARAAFPRCRRRARGGSRPALRNAPRHEPSVLEVGRVPLLAVQPVEREPVRPDEGLLVAGGAGERAGGSGRRVELIVVVGGRDPERGVEPRVGPRGLTLRRDLAEGPEGGHEREQREQEEVRDQPDTEAPTWRPNFELIDRIPDRCIDTCAMPL